MNFYRRNLPHLQPPGGEYFITFNLQGSLPKKVISDMRAFRKEQFKSSSSGKFPQDKASEIERKIFLTYESVLDDSTSGPQWLKKASIAEVIKKSIHYRDNIFYDLYAYCIMSNHVHIVFKHLTNNSSIKSKHPITDIMGSLKKFTSRNCNIYLNRSGAFWQSESFDRLIRNNNELTNVISYTIHNPVRAGLINKWENWPHTYLKKNFVESFN